MEIKYLFSAKFSVYVRLLSGEETGSSRPWFPGEHRCMACRIDVPNCGTLKNVFIQFRESGYEMPFDQRLLAWLTVWSPRQDEPEQWVDSEFWLTEGLHCVGRGRVLRLESIQERAPGVGEETDKSRVDTLPRHSVDPRRYCECRWRIVVDCESNAR